MKSFLLTTIVLSYSFPVNGWPQLRNGLSFSRDELQAEDIIADVTSRGLPDVDETLSWGTLPVPQLTRPEAAGNQQATKSGEVPGFKPSQQGDVKRELSGGGISPGLMTLPVLHFERPSLDKRGLEVKLENRSDVAYYVQLSIGNPAQKVLAQLDTGSFELWVNPDCRNLSFGDKQFCREVGIYDPSASSSSKISRLGKELRYGIGSANVTYVVDDIALGSSEQMKQVQFGVARSTKDQFSGILGLGHGSGVNTGYKNFVDQLADQKVTKSKAYSVALGSKSDKSGVVVFGGVDTGKFSGRLAALPLIPGNKSPDGVTRFWVNMTSMQHTSAAGETTDLTTKTLPVFIDSGATLTLLPAALANATARSIGARALSKEGFYMMNCGLAKSNGTINFNFNGVSIRVPYREIIREVPTSPPSCYLGIMPSQSFTLLGDTFMRSAYVVFDISNNMTYLAPYANCGSNTQLIDASTNMKSIVGACSAQQGSEISQLVDDPEGVINANDNNGNGAGSAGISWRCLSTLAIGALTLQAWL
ncbi:secreted aspartic proteinase [Metarhizium rileyi]|uniref:Secreted aspartic proteinase n=1 Tax=Metarhizium rileyi (strain RCEF 4871) TaxID=1649241 RepID=A0A167CAR7_METRR|nr:secreted aspartic proteinase [Metarhizium rileyi RCEF 4871]TWU70864.1 hypothetical protein ED733_001277 [Metarhizium rileyi]